MTPITTIVMAAFLLSGALKALTPLLMASMPVKAVQPPAKARSRSHIKAKPTSDLLAGTASSKTGSGAKPNLSTMGTILRLPHAYVGMLMFSTSLAGLHGVYSILPAYLVEHSTWSAEQVNSLVTLSRLISISVLLLAGPIIKYMGKRNTIIMVLLFTGLLTGLISVAEGRLLAVVVVFQPALIAVMFPAQLSCLAEIGEAWYQNVTTALVVTVGMIVGSGVVPALVGVLGDLGIGWSGFVALALFMFLAVVILIANPSFGTR